MILYDCCVNGGFLWEMCGVAMRVYNLCLKRVVEACVCTL